MFINVRNEHEKMTIFTNTNNSKKATLYLIARNIVEYFDTAAYSNGMQTIQKYMKHCLHGPC